MLSGLKGLMICVFYLRSKGLKNLREKETWRRRAKNRSGWSSCTGLIPGQRHTCYPAWEEPAASSPEYGLVYHTATVSVWEGPEEEERRRVRKTSDKEGVRQRGWRFLSEMSKMFKSKDTKSSSKMNRWVFPLDSNWWTQKWRISVCIFHLLSFMDT